MDTTIDEVKIEIESSSASAGSNLDKLAQSISTLQKSLSPATTKLNKFNKTLSNLKNNSSKIKTSGGGLFGGMTKGVAGATIKTTAFIAVMKKVAGVLGNAVTQSNAYVENLNLFRVSMGEATKQATEFVQEFSNALGIDPSNVMRYMGMFNTLAEGFGLSSESAYIMSKNLTQLSYDMSSFLNIPIDQAMQKIKSGFSGEIEPMRAIGIALDQATLQQTAYTLGIDKKISTMTRAQKTELLYYQMMTRTNKMQGDMARTLIAPANALRILKEQFTLLARAIGNMVLPVIMQVLPYVSLLTQALTALANRIANFFGFELPDIDYSSLDGISAGIEDIGDGATATGKKLDKMLNKFDELNVIDFGKESGAGAGDDLLNGGSLGIPLYDYDALENIVETTTEKIKKKLEGFFKKFEGIFKAISKIVNKFKPLFKGLGNALLVVLGGGMIKKIATFISKIKGFSSLSKIIQAFSIASSVAFEKASKFGLSLKGISTFATNLWGNLRHLISQLSPFTKALGTLASVAGIFTTTYSAIKDFNAGTAELGTTILNVGVAVAGFGTALSLLVGGPLGIAITAITALVAGCEAYEAAQKELTEQKALADLFDGQGQSMEAVIDYYSKLSEETTKYTDTILNGAEEIDNNNEKFDETAISIENLSSKMSSLFYEATDADFDNMNNNFEELGTIAQENLAKMVTGILTNINHIKDLGQIDDETAQKMIDNAIKVQQAQGNKVADLQFQMIQLNTAYRDGEKTQEEYRAEVAELLKEMARLNEGVSLSETQFQSFADNMNSQTLKINLEDPTKAKEYIQELSTIYNDQMENIKNSNLEIENYYDNLILQAEGDAELVKALEEDKLKMMEENQAALETIQGDYKGLWLTIKSEIIASGAETTEEMKGVVEEINTNLEGLGSVDVSGVGGEVLNNFLSSLEKENPNIMSKVLALWNQNGIDMKNTLSSSTEFSEAENEIINKHIYDAMSISGVTMREILTMWSDAGGEIKDEYGNSLKFTEEEMAIIDGYFTGVSSPRDMATILKKIMESGVEIKDQYGNALEFTQEEKDSIDKMVSGALILSPTHAANVKGKMRLFSIGVVQETINGIYSKMIDTEEAGKEIGNTVTDGTIISFAAKKEDVNSAAIEVIKEANESMEMEADGATAGNKTMNQLTTSFTDGKWGVLQSIAGLGTEIGTTLSNNMKVNGGTLKSTLGSAISTVLSGFKKVNVDLFDKIGFKLPTFKWFADGGFPETGQFFVARESGPELVGNIGNRAAVANNDQIIAGIAQASYEGVSQALRENSSRDRQPVNVYVGNKKLYSGYGQYANSESNMYGASTIRI